MKRTIFIAFAFFVFCNVESYAQQTVFDLIFYKHDDGCFTYHTNAHYDYISRVHRNDNKFVNGQINEFWNLVKQLNAISIQQQRSGMRASYIYFIETEESWVDGGIAILYHYNIFRVR